MGGELNLVNGPGHADAQGPKQACADVELQGGPGDGGHQRKPEQREREDVQEAIKHRRGAPDYKRCIKDQNHWISPCNALMWIPRMESEPLVSPKITDIRALQDIQT